jgi:hypothetical protein
MQRGLLGQVAIGRQVSEQVDEEVGCAAMTRMFDLADVLELIDDRFNQGAFAQQESVGELDELSAHVLAECGDEPQSQREEKQSSLQEVATSAVWP